jgi:hypothetical protein
MLFRDGEDKNADTHAAQEMKHEHAGRFVKSKA